MAAVQAEKSEAENGALAARLKREMTGDVFFDRSNRGRYATDASFYQIMPLGVVVPRTIDEALRALDDVVMRYSAHAFLGFDWDRATPERREEQRAITPDIFSFYVRTDCSFVAEDDGILVGYVLAQPLRHFDLEPLAVWVEDISVHPDYHRRGIASTLYRTLHDWGRSAGAGRIGSRWPAPPLPGRAPSPAAGCPARS